MRWEGCKDGCFWTTVSPGTCAKAVCSHLSQHQHGVGCHGKPCGCDALHNCGKSYSQIFKLLKPLKISRMFIYQAIKHYKELWRVEDRAWSGCLKTVRAEAAIKTVQERIRWNLLWKQKIMSQKLNISTHSSCASSGMICTWERTSTQRDTYLILLWRRSDGQEENVSSSGTPRTGTKTSSSWTRKFSPSRSSIITRTRRFMLKRPLRCILRVQGGHHASDVMVWWEVSHQGVTHLHFCKKGVKLVSENIKRTCYKELWNILTWPSSVARNGSSSRTQFLPKRPRQLMSGCGETFWPSSAPENWLSGSADLKTLGNKLWAVLEDMVCRKHHNSLDSLRRSLVKTAAEIPWRRIVRWQQSGQSISGLSSRHRAAILSDIIINENLKLLQINYLAQKVDVLFNFPSRAHCTWNRTYGKTMYIITFYA